MPIVYFAILQALVRLGGGGRTRDVAEVAGYAYNGFSIYRPKLVKNHWADCRHGFWVITERGKIALAIEVGRQAKRRGIK